MKQPIRKLWRLEGGQVYVRRKQAVVERSERKGDWEQPAGGGGGGEGAVGAEAESELGCL